MRKTIYVHIGAPKTGTSSIQDFLFQNRRRLAEEHDLSFPIMDSEEFRISANGKVLCDPSSFQCIAEKLSELPTSRVVLSEEMIFLNGSVRNLSKLEHSGLTIKVIVYLRNAPDYLASLWGESNKYENGGSPSSLSEFLDSDTYLLDLRALCQAMAASTKIDFIVRVYDRACLLKENSVDDFLQAIGAEAACNLPRPKSSNVSKGRAWSDLMQELLQYDFICERKIEKQLFEAECNRAITFLSGDNRRIIETMDNQTIAYIVEKHRATLDDVMSLARITHFQHFPNCYGRRRAAYRPLRALPWPVLGLPILTRPPNVVISKLAERLRNLVQHHV